MILTNIIITAYTLSPYCTPISSHGLCANGQKPVAGLTIAASREIPFHTKVEWNGHTYEVMDRLAKKYDGRVDIFFNTMKEAKDFGIKRKQTIKVNYDKRKS